MKRWEFLIQKEGDRLWTPINQATWELEEGRYRIVAHASQPNYEVEIRITYQSLESDRPRSQIQSSFCRTNEQGLIMILPFTYFEAGTWELRCYSDLMSELLGRGWQKQVQLEVFSQIKSDNSDLELPEHSQFSENNLLINNTTQENLAVQEITHEQDKATYYLQQLEQLLRQKIEPMLHSSEDELVSTSTTNVTDGFLYELTSLVEFDEPNITSLPEGSKPNLRLIFNQEQFNRSEGEPILISGTVEAEESSAVILSGFKGKIRYQLQVPETKQIINTFEESVEETTFPFIFNYALEIPSEWEMDLLTVWVFLESESGIEIDSQPLTIATDLMSYVSNSVNYTITLSDTQEQTSFAFDLLLDEEIVKSPLNIDLPQPAQVRRFHKYLQTSEGQILPAKIVRTSKTSKANKTLQLPPIHQLQSRQRELLEQESISTEEGFQSSELKERFLKRLGTLAEKVNS